MSDLFIIGISEIGKIFIVANLAVIAVFTIGNYFEAYK